MALRFVPDLGPVGTGGRFKVGAKIGNLFVSQRFVVYFIRDDGFFPQRYFLRPCSSSGL